MSNIIILLDVNNCDLSKALHLVGMYACSFSLELYFAAPSTAAAAATFAFDTDIV